jgi:hypothetical protein
MSLVNDMCTPALSGGVASCSMLAKWTVQKLARKCPSRYLFANND